MKEEQKKARANCTMQGCVLSRPDCKGCGFDKTELRRRKKLPLVLNEKTGLHRKIVGKKEADK